MWVRLPQDVRLSPEALEKELPFSASPKHRIVRLVLTPHPAPAALHQSLQEEHCPGRAAEPKEISRAYDADGASTFPPRMRLITSNS
eukprot:CAMPEP_0180561188 /NCGR_PEP_ID=MMETSP1037_2-20121125/3242_1 /TAXON_ID=632150 /ORGANISM="Azadinium spinosum, Strain 3D9" /LENGTH=86 /DNA_ID=CAMNT_0022577801 /DNA_START=580 /DNA_END=837 /DNA_ORIENTATION=+